MKCGDRFRPPFSSSRRGEEGNGDAKILYPLFELSGDSDWDLVGSPDGRGRHREKPNLKITLHVYDWAHVDSETLIRAKQEATRIYREIGVETIWLDHSIDGSVQNSAPGVSEISVNIIPQASRVLVC